MPLGPRTTGDAALANWQAARTATCKASIRVSSQLVSRFATHRPTEPERMDADDVPQDEIDTTFRFIRLVNRWLGGANACLRAIRADRAAWPKDRPLRWLDVGTGAADIPLAIDRWATRHGISIECVAVDRHAACLEVARRAVGSHSRIRLMEADALGLDEQLRKPSEPPPFDYVHAGMFLHHLADEDVIRVLRVMGRLARRHVIWNDLLRSRWSALAVRTATIGQPPIVRDDATLSVAKGFTPAEIREAARWAGLEQVVLRTHPLVGRFVLTGLRP